MEGDGSVQWCDGRWWLVWCGGVKEDLEAPKFLPNLISWRDLIHQNQILSKLFPQARQEKSFTTSSRFFVPDRFQILEQFPQSPININEDDSRCQYLKKELNICSIIYLCGSDLLKTRQVITFLVFFHIIILSVISTSTSLYLQVDTL